MNKTDNTSSAAPRKPGLMRVVLVVSLALNLLVLGVLAGGLWQDRRTERVGSPSELRALMMAMPDGARRDLRHGDNARNPERAAAREERRARAAERRAEILSLLRAPEFDAEAFATALEAEHAERSARIAQAHRVFVARVADLDAAERAAVADRMEEGRGRRFSRR